MNIEIIGTESLGVRGLCCFVQTKDRKILIDPGAALGYKRHGLLPHPLQVAVDERVQARIFKRWSEATDVVISHFHGDHVPLADANPYQLSIKKLIGLNPGVRVWTKSIDHLPPLEAERADAISSVLKIDLITAQDSTQGPITFSAPVPHGLEGSDSTVMMTRIQDDYCFVHASDNQLLNRAATDQILAWEPDIVLTGGPPLYLRDKLSKDQIRLSWRNAVRLSGAVDTLIVDHHLLRDFEGVKWLKRLSGKTKKRVMCGADFMKRPRMLLEARRKQLYRDMPVSVGWHDAYAKGKVKTDRYWKGAGKVLRAKPQTDIGLETLP